MGPVKDYAELEMAKVMLKMILDQNDIDGRELLEDKDYESIIDMSKGILDGLNEMEAEGKDVAFELNKVITALVASVYILELKG